MDCSGVSRRDFLQIGAAGLGAACLPGWWGTPALAGLDHLSRNRSVVMLFLSGGPSHIETFNPNMDGPAPTRSATGEVQTTIPGLTFGGTFPLLSQQAHHFAVVRSFQHNISGHVQAIVHVLTGGTDPVGERQTGYSLGSAYSRIRGANHEQTGMPTYTVLNSEEVDPQYRSERSRVENASHAGSLGAASAPFIPGAKGPGTENMQLRMDLERFQNRRALLGELDFLKAQTEQFAQYQGVDQYTSQAFDVILGSAATAFDLTREDPRTIQRYDTSHIKVGKKTFQPSQLGKQFLLARRLIEAGCGYLTIHSAGWDMHADTNNPGIVSGMEMLGSTVDRAVSAFLEDLEQRGLLDQVLLVITGDFGRTPRINAKGGRDHWPRLSTLAFAGGGVCQGQIIGQSTRGNDSPASEPYNASHLLATVMHYMLDISEARLVPGIPRELLTQLESHAPLLGLNG